MDREVLLYPNHMPSKKPHQRHLAGECGRLDRTVFEGRKKRTCRPGSPSQRPPRALLGLVSSDFRKPRRHLAFNNTRNHQQRSKDMHRNRKKKTRRTKERAAFLLLLLPWGSFGGWRSTQSTSARSGPQTKTFDELTVSSLALWWPFKSMPSSLWSNTLKSSLGMTSKRPRRRAATWALARPKSWCSIIR